MALRSCGRVLIGVVQHQKRVVAAVAVFFGSILLSAAAAAEPSRSAQAVRITGSIEVHANLAQDIRSLTFNARAEFNVALTTNPEEFATVQLTYDWTGASGSCRWSGSGSDGELRLRLRGIRSGRPLVEFSGSTPRPSACNDEGASGVNFYLYAEDHDGRGPIAPDVGWATVGQRLDGRGTGTLSLQCAGCGTPPGATYAVRAMWGRQFDFVPRRPRAGRIVRMTENVVLLEKSSRDTTWSEVRSANVTVTCDVYYNHPRRRFRKVAVRGGWLTPDQIRGPGGDGAVVCGPWRIPRSARGSWMGITPRVTYRGKTLAPVRGGRGFIRVGLFFG